MSTNSSGTPADQLLSSTAVEAPPLPLTQNSGAQQQHQLPRPLTHRGSASARVFSPAKIRRLKGRGAAGGAGGGPSGNGGSGPNAAGGAAVHLLRQPFLRAVVGGLQDGGAAVPQGKGSRKNSAAAEVQTAATTMASLANTVFLSNSTAPHSPLASRMRSGNTIGRTNTASTTRLSAFESPSDLMPPPSVMDLALCDLDAIRHSFEAHTSMWTPNDLLDKLKRLVIRSIKEEEEEEEVAEEEGDDQSSDDENLHRHQQRASSGGAGQAASNKARRKSNRLSVAAQVRSCSFLQGTDPVPTGVPTRHLRRARTQLIWEYETMVKEQIETVQYAKFDAWQRTPGVRKLSQKTSFASGKLQGEASSLPMPLGIVTSSNNNNNATSNNNSSVTAAGGGAVAGGLPQVMMPGRVVSGFAGFSSAVQDTCGLCAVTNANLSTAPAITGERTTTPAPLVPSLLGKGNRARVDEGGSALNASITPGTATNSQNNSTVTGEGIWEVHRENKEDVTVVVNSPRPPGAFSLCPQNLEKASQGHTSLLTGPLPGDGSSRYHHQQHHQRCSVTAVGGGGGASFSTSFLATQAPPFLYLSKPSYLLRQPHSHSHLPPPTPEPLMYSHVWQMDLYDDLRVVMEAAAVTREEALRAAMPAPSNNNSNANNSTMYQAGGGIKRGADGDKGNEGEEENEDGSSREESAKGAAGLLSGKIQIKRFNNSGGGGGSSNSSNANGGVLIPLPTFVYVVSRLLFSLTYKQCFPTGVFTRALMDPFFFPEAVLCTPEHYLRFFPHSATHARALHGERLRKLRHTVASDMEPAIDIGDYISVFELLRPPMKTGRHSMESAVATPWLGLTPAEEDELVAAWVPSRTTREQRRWYREFLSSAAQDSNVCEEAAKMLSQCRLIAYDFFASIDTEQRGYISWSDFTDALIEQAEVVHHRTKATETMKSMQTNASVFDKYNVEAFPPQLVRLGYFGNAVEVRHSRSLVLMEGLYDYALCNGAAMASIQMRILVRPALEVFSEIENAQVEQERQRMKAARKVAMGGCGISSGRAALSGSSSSAAAAAAVVADVATTAREINGYDAALARRPWRFNQKPPSIFIRYEDGKRLNEESAINAIRQLKAGTSGDGGVSDTQQQRQETASSDEGPISHKGTHGECIGLEGALLVSNIFESVAPLLLTMHNDLMLRIYNTFCFIEAIPEAALIRCHETITSFDWAGAASLKTGNASLSHLLLMGTCSGQLAVVNLAKLLRRIPRLSPDGSGGAAGGGRRNATNFFIGNAHNVAAGYSELAASTYRDDVHRYIIGRMDIHKSVISSIHMFTNTDLFATSSLDGGVALTRLTYTLENVQLTPVRTFCVCESGVRNVVAAETAQVLAMQTVSNRIFLYGTTNQRANVELYDPVAPHFFPLVSLTVVEELDQVITTDTSGFVKVWSMRRCLPLTSFYALTDQAQSAFRTMLNDEVLMWSGADQGNSGVNSGSGNNIHKPSATLSAASSAERKRKRNVPELLQRNRHAIEAALVASTNHLYPLRSIAYDYRTKRLFATGLHNAVVCTFVSGEGGVRAHPDPLRFISVSTRHSWILSMSCSDCRVWNITSGSLILGICTNNPEYNLLETERVNGMEKASAQAAAGAGVSAADLPGGRLLEAMKDSHSTTMEANKRAPATIDDVMNRVRQQQLRSAYSRTISRQQQQLNASAGRKSQHGGSQWGSRRGSFGAGGDAQRAALAEISGALTIADSNQNDNVRNSNARHGDIACACVGQHERTVFYALTTGDIRVHRSDSGRLVKTYITTPPSTDDILAAAVHYRHTYIAVGRNSFVNSKAELIMNRSALVAAAVTGGDVSCITSFPMRARGGSAVGAAAVGGGGGGGAPIFTSLSSQQRVEAVAIVLQRLLMVHSSGAAGGSGGASAGGSVDSAAGSTGVSGAFHVEPINMMCLDSSQELVVVYADGLLRYYPLVGHAVTAHRTVIPEYLVAKAVYYLKTPIPKKKLGFGGKAADVGLDMLTQGAAASATTTHPGADAGEYTRHASQYSVASDAEGTCSSPGLTPRGGVAAVTMCADSLAKGGALSATPRGGADRRPTTAGRLRSIAIAGGGGAPAVDRRDSFLTRHGLNRNTPGASLATATTPGASRSAAAASAVEGMAALALVEPDAVSIVAVSVHLQLLCVVQVNGAVTILDASTANASGAGGGFESARGLASLSTTAVLHSFTTKEEVTAASFLGAYPCLVLADRCSMLHFYLVKGAPLLSLFDDFFKSVMRDRLLTKTHSGATANLGGGEGVGGGVRRGFGIASGSGINRKGNTAAATEEQPVCDETNLAAPRVWTSAMPTRAGIPSSLHFDPLYSTLYVGTRDGFVSSFLIRKLIVALDLRPLGVSAADVSLDSYLMALKQQQKESNEEAIRNFLLVMFGVTPARIAEHLASARAERELVRANSMMYFSRNGLTSKLASPRSGDQAYTSTSAFPRLSESPLRQRLSELQSATLKSPCSRSGALSSISPNSSSSPMEEAADGDKRRSHGGSPHVQSPPSIQWVNSLGWVYDHCKGLLYGAKSATVSALALGSSNVGLRRATTTNAFSPKSVKVGTPNASGVYNHHSSTCNSISSIAEPPPLVSQSSLHHIASPTLAGAAVSSPRRMNTFYASGSGVGGGGSTMGLRQQQRQAAIAAAREAELPLKLDGASLADLLLASAILNDAMNLLLIRRGAENAQQSAATAAASEDGLVMSFLKSTEAGGGGGDGDESDADLDAGGEQRKRTKGVDKKDVNYSIGEGQQGDEEATAVAASAVKLQRADIRLIREWIASGVYLLRHSEQTDDVKTRKGRGSTVTAGGRMRQRETSVSSLSFSALATRHNSRSNDSASGRAFIETVNQELLLRASSRVSLGGRCWGEMAAAAAEQQQQQADDDDTSTALGCGGGGGKNNATTASGPYSQDLGTFYRHNHPITSRWVEPLFCRQTSFMSANSPLALLSPAAAVERARRERRERERVLLALASQQEAAATALELAGNDEDAAAKAAQRKAEADAHWQGAWDQFVEGTVPRLVTDMFRRPGQVLKEVAKLNATDLGITRITTRRNGYLLIGNADGTVSLWSPYACARIEQVCSSTTIPGSIIRMGDSIKRQFEHVQSMLALEKQRLAFQTDGTLGRNAAEGEEKIKSSIKAMLLQHHAERLKRKRRDKQSAEEEERRQEALASGGNTPERPARGWRASSTRASLTLNTTVGGGAGAAAGLGADNFLMSGSTSGGVSGGKRVSASGGILLSSSTSVTTAFTAAAALTMAPVTAMAKMKDTVQLLLGIISSEEVDQKRLFAEDLFFLPFKMSELAEVDTFDSQAYYAAVDLAIARLLHVVCGVGPDDNTGTSQYTQYLKQFARSSATIGPLGGSVGARGSTLMPLDRSAPIGVGAFAEDLYTNVRHYTTRDLRERRDSRLVCAALLHQLESPATYEVDYLNFAHDYVTAQNMREESWELREMQLVKVELAQMEGLQLRNGVPRHSHTPDTTVLCSATITSAAATASTARGTVFTRAPSLYGTPHRTALANPVGDIVTSVSPTSGFSKTRAHAGSSVGATPTQPHLNCSAHTAMEGGGGDAGRGTQGQAAAGNNDVDEAAATARRKAEAKEREELEQRIVKAMELEQRTEAVSRLSGEAAWIPSAHEHLVSIGRRGLDAEGNGSTTSSTKHVLAYLSPTRGAAAAAAASPCSAVDAEGEALTEEETAMVRLLEPAPNPSARRNIIRRFLTASGLSQRQQQEKERAQHDETTTSDGGTSSKSISVGKIQGKQKGKGMRMTTSGGAQASLMNNKVLMALQLEGTIECMAAKGEAVEKHQRQGKGGRKNTPSRREHSNYSTASCSETASVMSSQHQWVAAHHNAAGTHSDGGKRDNTSATRHSHRGGSTSAERQDGGSVARSTKEVSGASVVADETTVARQVVAATLRMTRSQREEKERRQQRVGGGGGSGLDDGAGEVDSSDRSETSTAGRNPKNKGIEPARAEAWLYSSTYTLTQPLLLVSDDDVDEGDHVGGVGEDDPALFAIEESCSDVEDANVIDMGRVGDEEDPEAQGFQESFLEELRSHMSSTTTTTTVGTMRDPAVSGHPLFATGRAAHSPFAFSPCTPDGRRTVAAASYGADEIASFHSSSQSSNSSRSASARPMKSVAAPAAGQPSTADAGAFNGFFITEPHQPPPLPRSPSPCGSSSGTSRPTSAREALRNHAAGSSGTIQCPPSLPPRAPRGSRSGTSLPASAFERQSPNPQQQRQQQHQQPRPPSGASETGQAMHMHALSSVTSTNDDLTTVANTAGHSSTASTRPTLRTTVAAVSQKTSITIRSPLPESSVSSNSSRSSSVVSTNATAAISRRKMPPSFHRNRPSHPFQTLKQLADSGEVATPQRAAAPTASPGEPLRGSTKTGHLQSKVHPDTYTWETLPKCRPARLARTGFTSRPASAVERASTMTVAFTASALLRPRGRSALMSQPLNDGIAQPRGGATTTTNPSGGSPLLPGALQPQESAHFPAEKQQQHMQMVKAAVAPVGGGGGGVLMAGGAGSMSSTSHAVMLTRSRGGRLGGGAAASSQQQLQHSRPGTGSRRTGSSRSPMMMAGKGGGGDGAAGQKHLTPTPASMRWTATPDGGRPATASSAFPAAGSLESSDVRDLMSGGALPTTTRKKHIIDMLPGGGGGGDVVR